MKIYQPLTATYKLDFWKTKSELDLHCPLYARLQNDGFTVLSGRTYKGRVAFDIVVFKGRKAIAIIEVKREDLGHRVALDQTEQGFIYRQFGVPVILFWDMKKYDDLAEFLKSNRISKSEIGDDLRIQISKKEIMLTRLRDLRRRLDVASMAAFDAKSALPSHKELEQMEIVLEDFRDKVEELYKTI